MRLESIDNKREFDWGKTSRDYADHRAGYPDSFYNVSSALGIGLPQQTILDLGTGTGELARAFAKRGAIVTGIDIDIAANQIAEAERLAVRDGLDIVFQIGAAEAIDFHDASFNVISAGQSWQYFDASVMVPKVLRLLKPDGCLVLTHLLWLPLCDRIAEQSEALVLKHNPDWKGAGYNGEMPANLPWTRGYFDLCSFATMYEPLLFTREAWCGRIRACRGVGASLSAAEVEHFDVEHRALLAATAPESFEVMHQMTMHIYQKRTPTVPG